MKKSSILLVLFIFLFSLVGCGGDKEPSDPSKALLPSSSSEYEGKLYTDVQQDLEEAGFNNIKYDIIYDLITGWLVSDGEIEYVSIGGKKSFKSGTEFDKNVEIIISYHTFESNKPSEPKDNIEDTYDDKYQGEKYRVNIVVDFDPNIFLDIYDVDLRIDGRKFETLKHGVDGDFEFDLKPGKHKIAFTNINDTTVYGQIELDVQSDMSVTYWIKGHSDSVELKQQNIDKNAYFVITLNPNGGESMDTVKVKSGEKLTNPGRPKGMEDYQFKGWSEDGTNPIEYPYYVNKNVSLIALWELKPDLVFEQCWEVKFSSYSLYLLIDEDSDTVVWVGTNDTYVAEGKIINGDLHSGMTIEYTRKGTTWSASLRYNNSIALAKYIDNTGNTISNTYTLQVDSEKAEQYLDSIEYNYKSFTK